MNNSKERACVLIVDDMPENISLLNTLLMNEYDIKAASSGLEAIAICQSLPVDIILLDVMMPNMDGFETCRRLKADPLTRDIPVIFITAKDELEDQSTGFDCGGIDYITKPVLLPIVRARVKAQLALYNQNRTLEFLVQERTAELNATRLEILHRLGTAGEYRDNETGLHVVRVCRYSRLIALAYGLPESDAEMLSNAVALHDTGKIGIPDNILLKPGKLDADEWKTMQTHCEIGRQIIGNNPHQLLVAAATIALTHHERWDGTGYPHRQKEEDIPLFGRIAAIADVFDALTSVRPYKKAWSVVEATEEIVRCRGSHFDPQVVEAFLLASPDIELVKQQYADPVCCP